MTRQHEIASLAHRAHAAAKAGDREAAWRDWSTVRVLAHDALMTLRQGRPTEVTERQRLGAALIEAGDLYGAEEWTAAGRRLCAE